MDEAERNEIEIDVRTLSKDLGIPVIPTSARYKRGIPELLQTISEMANGKIHVQPHKIKRVPPNIEKAVDRLSKEILKEFPQVPNSRWLAFRLLEGDPQIIQALQTGVFA
jgi:Fe2+ transport system protein B